MKKLILLMLAFLIAFTGFVSANYAIDEVYVNDISATNTVQIELDTQLEIEVLLHGTGDNQDIQLKAWIGGYEYGTIEDVSEMFDVENGVSYKKTLTLEIPKDLDVDNNYYTLYVEAFGVNDVETKTYTLYFEEPRHKIGIKDVMITESETQIGVKLRLTNLGENHEEDIRVTVSIPELGISSRTYVDELAARNQETDYVNDEVTTQTLYLKKPSTSFGDYELKIQIDYNNDHTTTEKTEYVRIGSTSLDDSAFVSISQLSDLKVGKESTFKIQITNLENPRNFYIDVEGEFNLEYTEQVAVSGVQEVVVKATPLTEGTQTLKVSVSSDKGIIEENIYSYEVEEQKSILPVLIAFVLAIVAVVLALFVLRRVK